MIRVRLAIKRAVVWLAMRGLLDSAWFRSFGTWLVRKTGGGPL